MKQPDLSKVIRHDMCIGCGACVHADPSLALAFDPDKLMYEPSGPGNADAASVCPSVAVDFPWLHEQRFPGAHVGPLGVIDSVMLAQSTNHDRNVKASSGGLIKELLLHYLEQDDVDGIIALTHVEGLLFEPRLITRAEEVDGLPGSIYHNIPFDGALRLLKENEGRFVLVAIPCQLEGIFTYIHRHRPDLAARVHSTIGLLCGWTYTHHAIKAICAFERVDFDAITDISFRGGGPVGRLEIHTPDKIARVHRRVGFGYQVAFDRTFNIPRCHLCINHTNFLADIVVGDAWLPSTVFTKTGISLIICRTPAATQTMARMAERERVVYTEVSEDDIVESQTHRVAFGDFSYAYAAYLCDNGGYAPDMEGPNRVEAHPWPAKTVSAFHGEMLRKIKLQRQGRYRYLWYRKMTLEIGKFSARYVRWFFVRILRVKSLLGVRKEVPRDKLERFR